MRSEADDPQVTTIHLENRVEGLLGHLFKVHPLHGVSIGTDAPSIVTGYVEIVPTDTVKCELDRPPAT